LVIDTNRFVAYVLKKLTHLATAECRYRVSLECCFQ